MFIREDIQRIFGKEQNVKKSEKWSPCATDGHFDKSPMPSIHFVERNKSIGGAVSQITVTPRMCKSHSLSGQHHGQSPSTSFPDCERAIKRRKERGNGEGERN